MNRDVMDRTMAALQPDEFPAASRLLRLLEALGAETPEDAAEWRRRMVGWTGFHALSVSNPSTD